MKKIIVIGAGGSLATEVIASLKILNDVELTLFVRNKNKLNKNTGSGCVVIEGDAMNYVNVKNAVTSQDIVYVNLAGSLEVMTGNIVKAMNETEVKRIIAISSIGIYKTPLRPVLIPYRKLADIIEAANLDYTILRPDWFTDANESITPLPKRVSQKPGVLFPAKASPPSLLPSLKTPTCIKKKM